VTTSDSAPATGAPPEMADVLDALEETWTSIQGLLTELEPEEWRLATGCPGWDVADNVSHLTGFELAVLGVARPDHELPPDLAHVTDDNKRLTEVDVDYRRGRTPAELQEEFDAVVAASLARRRADPTPADEVRDGPFGWRLPYKRLLEIRVFDCFAHEQDIRRATGRPGHLEGGATRIANDMAEQMLPFLLPKRVPALEHKRVELRLDDRVVTIGGAKGDLPDAVIDLPVDRLVPLMGGRADAHPERLGIEGDRALGMDVGHAMGFTP